MKNRKQIIILSDETEKVVLSSKLADKEIIVLAGETPTVVGYEKYAKDEYKDEPDENGIYQPDDEKIQNKLDVIAQEEAKKTKAKELSELVIDINTVLYDAHQEAIGNMAAVVAIATATFQRAISVGVVKAGETVPTIMTPAEAYKYVYKDQTVTWKGADNKPHTVQVESLVEASEKAMTAKAVILFKY